MRFESLTAVAGQLPCFDLPLLVQAFPDRRAAIRLQLSRWIAQGKVVSLRRSLYTLADHHRRVPLDPAELAQHLCRPSYLSGLWALGFHDMIPERVVTYTSITTRLPSRFNNAYGGYEYRHIKPDAFFGYVELAYGNSAILVARPEKALLDHWHLSAGEWNDDRIHEMRYQNWAKVDHSRLREYAAQFRSPRLRRAVERWVTHAEQADDEGMIL